MSAALPHEGVPPGEKERVYTELERVQHKCARLKREVESLRRAGSAGENTTLRMEAARYKQALSAILHLLERDQGISDDDLRSIVLAALELRGMKWAHRARIQRFHKREEAGDG